MGRNKWRLVIELGGMAVVVISFFIVIFELRQNTAAIRGSTISAVSERQQFELYWSSEIAPVFVKAIQTPSQLTAVEAWQLSEWMTAAIVARQNEFPQCEMGLEDEDAWLLTEGTIQLMLRFEWSREWWNVYREVPWDSDFTARVDQLIEESSFDYKDVLEQLSKIGKD